jgi:hypothetical protein
MSYGQESSRGLWSAFTCFSYLMDKSINQSISTSFTNYHSVLLFASAVEFDWLLDSHGGALRCWSNMHPILAINDRLPRSNSCIGSFRMVVVQVMIMRCYCVFNAAGFPGVHYSARRDIVGNVILREWYESGMRIVSNLDCWRYISFVIASFPTRVDQSPSLKI